MPNQFLPQAKFLSPQIPKDAIHRPQLIERMNSGIEQKLVIVSAPAGYGKSTLVAQWKAQSSLPVAWFTADREDNTPLTFGNSLLHTVHRIFNPEAEPGTEPSRFAAYQTIEETERYLTDVLAGSGEEFVLVIDDYQHIDSPAIHQRLCDLIKVSSPHVHFILISRSSLPLSINCLRVRRQMDEIGPEDLRFNRAEIQLFFSKNCRTTLSEADLENLEKRCEGWAGCLQLASLSVQGMDSEGVKAFFSSFTSSNRYVWNYLIEEFYNQLPEDIREFMETTSILRRLSAPLCDAVTGRENSREILEYLENANLVVSLEDKRRWYRYPTMMNDFFYEMLLRNRTIDGTFEYHRRAARWYETLGELGEAAHHAFAALDTAYADKLLNRIQSQVNLGDYAAWQFNFLDLPDEVLFSHPDACYNCAVSLLLSNDLDHFERPMRIAEMAWEAAGDRANLGKAASIRAIVSHYRGNHSETVQLTEKALEFMPEDYLLERSSSRYLLAMANASLGRMAFAETLLPEAIEGLKKAGEFYTAEMAASGLARVQLYRGKLHQAESSYRTVISFTDGKVFDQILAGHIFLGVLYYEWNRLEQAEHHLRYGLEHEPAGRTGRFAPLAHLHLATIAFERGETRKALESMENAAAAAEQLHNPGWIQMVRGFRSSMAIRQGDLDTAQRLMEEMGPRTGSDHSAYENLMERVSRIRLLIAQGRARKASPPFQEAARLAEDLIGRAEKDGRGRDQVRLLTLLAVAQWNLNQHNTALETLHKAFVLAEPEDYVRTFLDEGDTVINLLSASLNRNGYGEYAGRLLAEAQPSQTLLTPVNDENLTASGLLSQRELEVLRAIALGMNTQAISDQFYLSPFTVRTHIRNIFKKLDAHSRSQAVKQGRTRGLL